MKKTSRQRLTFLLICVFCALIGWRVAVFSEKSKQDPTPASQALAPLAKPLPRFPRAQAPLRDEFQDGTTVEIFASREPNEVILRFPSGESYDAFFFALADSNIELLDQLDRLRAMRLSYDAWADLASLLDGENITAYDSLPAVPPPTFSGTAHQQGLLGFGNRLLPWLGVTGDNSNWGRGVKIAVLDNGVLPHSDLPGLTQSIAITPFPRDLAKTDGHGTAVASLIAGRNPAAPGIAPAAEIISIRVGDDAGRADSFALAAGILAAIDAGAQIINISMGTSENNPLIEEAVSLAHEHQVLIVAASGNSSRDEAAYPAAYPTVISVGAVDARGEHLDFSNYGTYLSITAPGYGISAAWPGNARTKISGTSASAPIVTGAIAATMSNGTDAGMNAFEAAEVVMAQANDAGLPGPDSQFGFGILNLGRVMNRHIAGVCDAAITDQRLVRTGRGGSGELQVTVQNRGTAVLVNTLLEVITPVGTRKFNATTLAAGSIQTFKMPIRLSGLSQDAPIRVVSKLSLGVSGHDPTPYNNRREDSLYVN
ncbi:MAG: hypothetical protein RLZZ245_367 [Verrucomicrobiota bacterium]